MYKFVAKNVLAPALDVIRGTQTMKCLKELEQSQWWPRDKILEQQKQSLQRLIQYAYDNVPYYRRIFDERALTPANIKSCDDLKILPTLKKQDIRNNLALLSAKGFPSRQRVSLHTSGSTGQQLFFYSTRYQHISRAFAERQRGLSAIGFELGDKYAQQIYRNQHESRINNYWLNLLDYSRRRMCLNVKEMIDDNMRHIAGKLEKFKPKIIRGFPSIIYELARFIQESKQYDIKPISIVTGGERLSDDYRNFFREVFGCDTYDTYGTEEQHTIAVECPLHTGYHIASESVIVEMIDKEGAAVPVGEEGNIILTNLHNYAMPLIRYEIGDKGVLSDRLCPCGRGLPLLESLSGRIYDEIVTKSQRPVPGQYLIQPFRGIYSRLNIDHFQVVQNKPGQVLIRIVKGKECRKNIDEISTTLIAAYKNVFGDDLDIVIESTKEIPRNEAGKLRKVISNLHPQ